MLVLLEGSPISTEELWSPVRVTIGFLVTYLTKANFPPIAQFGLTASSRKSVGGFKLIPFKNDGGHCVLGTFNDAEIWYPPDLCLDTILFLSFSDNSFDLMACSDMHCQLWDLIRKGVFLSKS